MAHRFQDRLVIVFTTWHSGYILEKMPEWQVPKGSVILSDDEMSPEFRQLFEEVDILEVRMPGMDSSGIVSMLPERRAYNG